MERKRWPDLNRRRGGDNRRIDEAATLSRSEEDSGTRLETLGSFIISCFVRWLPS
jgi:hypothetical protein